MNPRTTLAQPSHGEISAAVALDRRSWSMQDWLTWAYREQRADEVYGSVAGRVGPGGVRSGMVRAQRIGLLGVRVDCDGASGWGSAALHPDAEAIHEAVLRLPPECVGPVIHHAKTAGQPDWLPHADTSPRPVLNGKGKPVMIYPETGKRKAPIACRIGYDCSPAHLAFMRQQYLTWWAALAALATQFGRTWGWRVAPGAAREPWKKGD